MPNHSIEDLMVIGKILSRLEATSCALPAGPYYAQGYSGHGIASLHLMAQIMAEAISGTLERRFDAFSKLKHIRLPVCPLGLGLGLAVR